MVKKIARGGAKNISRSGKQIKQLNNYRITELQVKPRPIREYMYMSRTSLLILNIKKKKAHLSLSKNCFPFLTGGGSACLLLGNGVVDKDHE